MTFQQGTDPPEPIENRINVTDAILGEYTFCTPQNIRPRPFVIQETWIQTFGSG